MATQPKILFQLDVTGQQGVLAALELIRAEALRVAAAGGGAGKGMAEGFDLASHAAFTTRGALMQLEMMGARMIIGAAIIGLTKGLIEAGMAAERLEMKFRAAAGSFSAGNDAYQFAINLAQKYGLALESTADAYARFLVTTRGTSIEGMTARRVFESLTKAMAALQLPVETQTSAWIQLNQMVSKTRVNQQDMRVLAESFPGLYQAIATAMGITTAEMFKQMEAGKLLTSDVLPKLATYLDEVHGTAAQEGAQRTTAAWNRFKNEVLLTARAAGQELAPAFRGFFSWLAEELRRFRTGDAWWFTLWIKQLVLELSNLPERAKAVRQQMSQIDSERMRDVSLRAEEQRRALADKTAANLHQQMLAFLDAADRMEKKERAAVRGEVDTLHQRMQGFLDAADLLEKRGQSRQAENMRKRAEEAGKAWVEADRKAESFQSASAARFRQRAAETNTLWIEADKRVQAFKEKDREYERDVATLKRLEESEFNPEVQQRNARAAKERAEATRQAEEDQARSTASAQKERIDAKIRTARETTATELALNKAAYETGEKTLKEFWDDQLAIDQRGYDAEMALLRDRRGVIGRELRSVSKPEERTRLGGEYDAASESLKQREQDQEQRLARNRAQRFEEERRLTREVLEVQERIGKATGDVTGTAEARLDREVEKVKKTLFAARDILYPEGGFAEGIDDTLDAMRAEGQAEIQFNAALKIGNDALEERETKQKEITELVKAKRLTEVEGEQTAAEADRERIGLLSAIADELDRIAALTGKAVDIDAAEKFRAKLDQIKAGLTAGAQAARDWKGATLEWNTAMAALDRARAVIEREAQVGGITPLQAEDQIAELYAVEIERLRQIARLRTEIARKTNTPENVEAARAAWNELGALETDIASQGARDWKKATLEWSTALSDVARKRAEIERQVQLGQISAYEGERRSAALYREELALLRERAALLERIAKRTSRPEDEEAAKQAQEEVQRLETEAQTLGATFELSMSRFGKSIETNAQKWAEGAQGVIESAMGALDDFLVTAFTKGKFEARDALQSIFEDVMRLVVRLQVSGPLAQGISNILGKMFGGGGWSGTSNSVAPEGGGDYHAHGGYIDGPGTSTSDSIPARLSRGEYVLPASVVARPGMLEWLEHLRIGLAPPKRLGGVGYFATGGLVEDPRARPRAPELAPAPKLEVNVHNYAGAEIQTQENANGSVDVNVLKRQVVGIVRDDIARGGDIDQLLAARGLPRKGR